MSRRLCLDCALIHWRISCGIEGRTRWNQDRRGCLFVLRTGVDGNARGIDSLLGDQISLRVDRPLGCKLVAVLLTVGSVPQDSELCIGTTLQTECDLIQAGLPFIVHARRATKVPVKVDGT